MYLRCSLDNHNHSTPCLSPEQLLQTRVCGKKPCQRPLWQVGPWSECLASSGNICGNRTGVQERSIRCEVDPGKNKFSLRWWLIQYSIVVW